jgi:hypothetical protein
VGGAHFAFTDRWGGVSAAPYEELNLGGAVGDDPEAVRTNRELAAKSLGLDPARVVWMNQVHGADAVVVSAPWGERPVPRVDAIVTAERGLALAVLTADCTPVLLADPVAGIAPCWLGPETSGLVAMNRAPSSISRMAVVIASKEYVRVSPSTTYSGSRSVIT